MTDPLLERFKVASARSLDAYRKRDRAGMRSAARELREIGQEIMRDARATRDRNRLAWKCRQRCGQTTKLGKPCTRLVERPGAPTCSSHRPSVSTPPAHIAAEASSSRPLSGSNAGADAS